MAVLLPLSALTDLVSTLQIERIGSAILEVGEQVGFRLVPPPSEIRVTSLIMQGAVPLPVPIPVDATVSWKVLEEDGTTQVDTHEYLSPDLALGGVPPWQANFLFAPFIAEAVDNAPAPLPIKRLIQATVTVSVPPDTATQTLPAVPVWVQPLRIPVVAAFFRNSYYMPLEGKVLAAAFVMVPFNSVLKGVEGLVDMVNGLLGKVDRLKALAQFAFFLLALENLSNALSASPRIAFRSADAVPNLERVRLVEREKEFLGIPGTDVADNINAEDELSSLIFVAPPSGASVHIGKVTTSGWSLECFNQRDFVPDGGEFTVTTDADLCAMIPHLGGLIKNIQTDQSIPPGMVNVNHDPPHPPPRAFDNLLSSVRFVRTIQRPIPPLGLPVHRSSRDLPPTR